MMINANKDVDDSLDENKVYKLIQEENDLIRQKTGTAAAWAAREQRSA